MWTRLHHRKPAVAVGQGLGGSGDPLLGPGGLGEGPVRVERDGIALDVDLAGLLPVSSDRGVGQPLLMATSDIRTIRMPIQHTVRRASLFGAHMARGQADPHRRRAERRGAEAARQHAVALQAISAIPFDGRILRQMRSLGDRPWSGSCHALT
jgi:hypothetical protein